MKNLRLSGLIHSRFNSISDCSRNTGISNQKLGRILNGAEPTLAEYCRLCHVLGLDQSKSVDIFLPEKFPNGNKTA